MGYESQPFWSPCAFRAVANSRRSALLVPVTWVPWGPLKMLHPVAPHTAPTFCWWYSQRKQQMGEEWRVEITWFVLTEIILFSHQQNTSTNTWQQLPNKRHFHVALIMAWAVDLIWNWPSRERNPWIETFPPSPISVNCKIYFWETF